MHPRVLWEQSARHHEAVAAELRLAQDESERELAGVTRPPVSLCTEAVSARRPFLSALGRVVRVWLRCARWLRLQVTSGEKTTERPVDVR